MTERKQLTTCYTELHMVTERKQLTICDTTAHNKTERKHLNICNKIIHRLTKRIHFTICDKAIRRVTGRKHLNICDKAIDRMTEKESNLLSVTRLFITWQKKQNNASLSVISELHRDIEKHIICDNFPDWQAMHGNTNNLKKERREGLWWQLNLPDQS